MAWIFSCQLLISVCSLIIITLRSTFFPLKVLEDAGETWNHAAHEDYQKGSQVKEIFKANEKISWQIRF
jgi:hypothetical protein